MYFDVWAGSASMMSHCCASQTKMSIVGLNQLGSPRLEAIRPMISRSGLPRRSSSSRIWRRRRAGYGGRSVFCRGIMLQRAYGNLEGFQRHDHPGGAYGPPLTRWQSRWTPHFERPRRISGRRRSLPWARHFCHLHETRQDQGGLKLEKDRVTRGRKWRKE
jgi:hypothetical protein